MGTRCLTVFKDDDGEEICVLYRQFDGYVEGHGNDLVKFLKGKKVVNGFGHGENLSNAFNGMGCLTAAVIAHFKTEIGNFYLYPAGTRDCGEEFIYTVEDLNGGPYVKVYDLHEKKTAILLAGGDPSKDEYEDKETKVTIKFNPPVDEEGRKAIRFLLNKNEFFKVHFTKKDGEKRILAGTRQGKFFENQEGRGLKFDPKKLDLLPVWDLESDGYRMINLKTVTKVEIVD